MADIQILPCGSSKLPFRAIIWLFKHLYRLATQPRWFRHTEPLKNLVPVAACEGEGGRLYAACVVGLLRPGPDGLVTVVKIFERSPVNGRWYEVPPTPQLSSRLRSLIACRWPPASLDRLSWDRGSLCMDFHSARPSLLSRGPSAERFEENPWRAWYSSETRKWTLERLERGA